MPGPPPPPPPPPPSVAPPQPFGGGGTPAFLADIRKGAKLKKVPDSQKNDRSAALVPGGGGIGSVGGGSGPAGRPGPLPLGGQGGGGAVPSNADIKSKLNAMFGGGVPVLRSSAPSHHQASHETRPAAPPLPPRPPSGGDLASTTTPTSISKSQLQPNSRSAPHIPEQQSRVIGYTTTGPKKAQAPQPPTATFDGAGVFNPIIRSGNPTRPPPPPVPARQLENSQINDWESQFQFPDESTFPPPPEPYHGTRTYVKYILNADGM